MDLDDIHKVVCRRRTGVGYGSTAELEAAYEALFAAVGSYHRPEYALLSDLRLAPPRNDPAFEQTIGRYHARFYGGFRRIAHVVVSEAGRLQVVRLAQPETARRMRVFTSEAAAFEFLTTPSGGGLPAARRAR